jgi:hypothetical protein
MVRFEEDKLVIELSAICKSDSLEKWTGLQKSLCNIIRSMNDENIYGDFDCAIDLLGELVPDWKDAKKMIE